MCKLFVILLQVSLANFKVRLPYLGRIISHCALRPRLGGPHIWADPTDKERIRPIVI